MPSQAYRHLPWTDSVDSMQHARRVKSKSISGKEARITQRRKPRLFTDLSTYNEHFAQRGGRPVLIVPNQSCVGGQDQAISAALIGMTDSKFVILLMINIILLIVGTFMDMTPAVLIFTPIFLPIVIQLGITPLHFGIMMVLNLCIGLCTPPVGSVLFLGCSIGKTTIADITKTLLPFFLVMIIVLMLITYIPGISLFLPKLFGY